MPFSFMVGQPRSLNSLLLAIFAHSSARECLLCKDGSMTATRHGNLHLLFVVFPVILPVTRQQAVKVQ